MPQNIHLSKSIFDKALNTEAKKNYRLSIRVSPDGFSFCVLDTNRNKYSGLENYEFQDIRSPLMLEEALKVIIEGSQWLDKDYQGVKVMFEGQQMSLVPNPLFDAGQAPEYLRFNHFVDADDEICHDHLPNLDAVNVFSIPGNIAKLLNQFFPGIQINHFSSALIESLLIRNKNWGEGRMIFVNVRKQWLDIIVLDGRKLLFFNSFQYRTKEDFAYYLIYVIEQLNINPENVELVLMGEILKISDIYDIIYKYVRNLKFIERGEEFSYSYVFDETPGHFYYNLLNLQRCEL
ncbi:MAG: hypothetical protein B6D64_04225 [Bacteroidetes bacterium 4484_276]|nr:MAG: hypothetical protein B6D64_04225 [Bacteroidetes bacterium 4484_276]OYT13949.1 MAG: hypothetical protein B6I19_02475 [Bacteroidetes bacterium 4572_114]